MIFFVANSVLGPMATFKPVSALLRETLKSNIPPLILLLLLLLLLHTTTAAATITTTTAAAAATTAAAAAAAVAATTATTATTADATAAGGEDSTCSDHSINSQSLSTKLLKWTRIKVVDTLLFAAYSMFRARDRLGEKGFDSTL